MNNNSGFLLTFELSRNFQRRLSAFSFLQEVLTSRFLLSAGAFKDIYSTSFHIQQDEN